MSKLTIATCQFPSSRDIDLNVHYAVRLIRRAAASKAKIVHFHEAALSGYAGVDFDSIDDLDWNLLRGATESLLGVAKELGVWVVLGSTHRLGDGHKPHNSLYLIDSNGRPVDRYDKRFCTKSDLEHYSPGNHTVTFDIEGVRCGLLICYDFRFQELYREHKRLGVQLMFHSFHNAARPERPKPEDNVLGHIAPATMYTYAANNHFWISATNSSRRFSCWPSFVVQPDGRPCGRLRLNTTGLLITEVDPEREFYDAPGENRARAMEGVFHSGTLVSDPRSSSRTAL